jgi:hypothetical protein
MRGASLFGLVLTAASGLAAQTVVQLPRDDHGVVGTVEAVYTLGLDAGESWQQFEQITAAAFGPDARLYLVDEGSGAVIAVGPDGHLVRRLGAKGQGPGEFRRPAAVAPLRDGRVAVWSTDKRAFVMFDSAGTVLDEIRPTYDVGLPGRPLVPEEGGALLSFPARMTTGRLGHAYLTGRGVVRAQDTLPVLRIPLRDGAPVEVVTQARMPANEGDARSVVRAFEPLPSMGVLAGGRIALQDREDYRIRVLDRKGMVERILTRPIPPHNTTRADRNAFKRSIEGQRVHVLGQPGATAGRLPDPWFYPVVPPILSITTDGRHHIWVQRRDAKDPTQPGPLDILTDDGRYLGTLSMREAGVAAAFGPDGLVVFLGQGPLDVPVARVYRLPPALR